MKRIGLTGGIACGKSAVSAILRKRGVPVIDADLVAREVVLPGQPALAEIAARFHGVLQADGTLDRAALGARVMGDAEARKALEAITHPRILAEIVRRLGLLEDSGHAAAVVEAALMVETGSWRFYDAVLVVRCAPETQISRLRDRLGCDEAEARRWIEAQMPLEEKVRVATAVIDNDGTLDELERTVDAVWSNVRA